MTDIDTHVAAVWSSYGSGGFPWSGIDWYSSHQSASSWTSSWEARCGSSSCRSCYQTEDCTSDARNEWMAREWDHNRTEQRPEWRESSARTGLKSELACMQPGHADLPRVGCSLPRRESLSSRTHHPGKRPECDSVDDINNKMDWHSCREKHRQGARQASSRYRSAGHEIRQSFGSPQASPDLSDALQLPAPMPRRIWMSATAPRICREPSQAALLAAEGGAKIVGAGGYGGLAQRGTVGSLQMLLQVQEGALSPRGASGSFRRWARARGTSMEAQPRAPLRRHTLDGAPPSTGGAHGRLAPLSDQESRAPHREGSSGAGQAAGRKMTQNTPGEPTSASALAWLPALMDVAAIGGPLADKPALPLPPNGSCSWDWPLSRHERKARVVMLDRRMLMLDCQALLARLGELHGCGSQPDMPGAQGRPPSSSPLHSRAASG